MENRLFPIKPTLGQTLVLGFLGLAVALALVFAVVLNETRASIFASSERIREQASREIGERITSFLSTAPDTVAAFQRQISLGLIDPDNPKSIESALFTLLLAEGEIGEITFTRARQTGFDEEGAIELAATPRWQISVVRAGASSREMPFWSRYVYQENSSFFADRQILEPHSSPLSIPKTRMATTDPTSHLTFSTPASKEYQGQLLWSDLHWSELDEKKPEGDREVEVSVQQAVADAANKFAGVVRVGLLAEQLDRAVQLKLTPEGEDDPHRIFLCDPQGRLITRGVSSDRVTLSGDDLRLAPPEDLAPEVASALSDPKLRAVGTDLPVSGQFRRDGQEFLTTFRSLPGTQDWLIGIVV
ncbi:MAG TPA: cache domain-containing protein, partial [Terrimicrobiaceae bacterium]